MTDGGGTVRGRRFGIQQGRRGIGAIADEIAEGWRRGDAVTRLGLAIGSVGGAGLLGASLFGLTHVFGGAFHGNPRAIGFGVGLTTASMWLLAGLARILRLLVDRSTR